MNPGNVAPYGALVRRASMSGGAEVYERVLLGRGVRIGVAGTIATGAVIGVVTCVASPEIRAKVRGGLSIAKQSGVRLVERVEYQVGPHDVLSAREQCRQG